MTTMGKPFCTMKGQWAEFAVLYIMMKTPVPRLLHALRRTELVLAKANHYADPY